MAKAGVASSGGGGGRAGEMACPLGVQPLLSSWHLRPGWGPDPSSQTSKRNQEFGLSKVEIRVEMRRKSLLVRDREDKGWEVGQPGGGCWWLGRGVQEHDGARWQGREVLDRYSTASTLGRLGRPVAREWPAPRWMQGPFLAGSSPGPEGFCP